MTSRRDTLSERVARAQREIASWPPSLLASMQLQGASDAEALGHSRTVQHAGKDAPKSRPCAFIDEEPKGR